MNSLLEFSRRDLELIKNIKLIFYIYKILASNKFKKPDIKKRIIFKFL